MNVSVSLVTNYQMLRTTEPIEKGLRSHSINKMIRQNFDHAAHYYSQQKWSLK